MTTEFLFLSQVYAFNYSQSLRKSRLSVLSTSRREFLIRNAYGKSTIELFFRLNRNLGISHLIECGANDASVSRRFLEEKEGRSALAIEANPFVYANYLALNSNYPTLDYKQLGLSNKKGYMDFFIPNVTDKSQSIFGSFQKLPEFYTDYTSVEVELNTLDSLQMIRKKVSPSAMWVDVEGEAYKVFSGARKLLDSGYVKLIYCEVQESVHYKNEKSAIEIAEYLGKFGFVPIARDFPLANLYNLLFIHKDSMKDAISTLNSYWSSLSEIRAPAIEIRAPRESFAKLKKKIFGYIPKPLEFVAHKLFALAGSNSSKKIVDSMNI